VYKTLHEERKYNLGQRVNILIANERFKQIKRVVQGSFISGFGEAFLEGSYIGTRSVELLSRR